MRLSLYPHLDKALSARIHRRMLLERSRQEKDGLDQLLVVFERLATTADHLLDINKQLLSHVEITKG